MAATSGIMMVNSPVNLTGLLFNKTRIETPLFNILCSRAFSLVHGQRARFILWLLVCEP